AEIKSVEIGYAVDGAEEYLCYVVVKVPRQRTEEELSTDNGDQGCSNQAGFPVPDFSDKKKDDRDHQCPEDGGYPERRLDDFRPGCCSCQKAYNTADKGEQRSPWHSLARWKECHCLKPAVAREVSNDLFDLPE